MFRNHRNDFPTLSGENAPVYLDNACMTLRPTSVIEAIRSYYEESQDVEVGLFTGMQQQFLEKWLIAEITSGNYSMQTNPMRLFLQRTQHIRSIRWQRDSNGRKMMLSSPLTENITQI